MKLYNIINEEILNLSETYQSIQEIKNLANDIIKATAEFNYENINRNKSFQYLYGINLKTIDPSKYNELKEFINNSNVYIYFQPDKNELNKRGDYSAILYKKKNDYKPNAEKEINVFYDYNSLKDDLDKLINEKGEISANDVYFKIFYKLYQTLIHELQHAFDDYRSKSMTFKTKQMQSYKDKYYKYINNDIIKDLEQSKKYLNLPHEIWARFSQTITKINFTNVDFNDQGIVYSMYPIETVIIDFKNYFDGYNYLSDTMKRKLLNKVVQFWHYEEEKTKELNKQK